MNPKHTPWTDQEDRALAAMWGKGLTGTAISRRIGRSTNAVLGRRLRLGLTPRAPAIPHRVCMRHLHDIEAGARAAAEAIRKEMDRQDAADGLLWCPHHLRPYYRELVDAGKSPEEAQNLVAERAERENDAIRRELLEMGA